MQKAITLYNASAGSGKTFQLVASVLLLLLRNKDPYFFQRILALTFTNKAANEMKTRLIDWLTLLSDTKNQNDKIFIHIQKESGLTTEELAVRSKKILSAILQRYSRLSISTLDSFFNRMLRSFSKELGVNYQSEMVFDAKPYIKKAVGQLIFDAEKDADLRGFLSETVNSQMERDKSWNLAKDLEKNLSDLFAENQFEQIKPFAKFGFEQYSNIQNDWRKELKTLKTETREIGKQFLQLLDDNGLSVEDLNRKSTGFASFFLNLSKGKYEHPTDSVEKTFASEEFTTKSAKAETKAAVEAISDEFKRLFHQAKENTKRISELNAFLNELISLALLGGVTQRLEEQKEKQGFLLQSDVAKIISENLRNQPSAYIYEKIGQRYTTIFIDEFQDTSPIQWGNLNPLIEEKSAYGQKTILVGDPKQAIYRFRGGDQEIMVSLANNPEVEVVNLETNYRSCKAIVEFNNQFYQSVLEKMQGDDYKKIYQQGLKQKSNSEKTGSVEVVFLAKPDKDSEEKVDEMVLSSVLQKVQTLSQEGYQKQDICILVRTKKHAELVANLLQENNFSVLTEEALLLYKNTSIDLLIQFLFLTDDPREINKLEFITRFIAFYNYQPKEEISVFIQDFCKKDWREILAFLESEGFAFSLDESENLYSLVQNAIFGLKLELGVYLLTFLNYVEKQKNRNGNSLAQFLENWEEDKEKLSLESQSTTCGIRVMTMHKSKGLEFPVVLLPFFDERNNKPDSIWLSYPELPFKQFRVNATNKFRPTNDLAEQELEKNLLAKDLDNLNLLYVATTRAVEHMFLVLPESGNNKMADIVRKYLKEIGLNAGETKTIFGTFHPKEKAEETNANTNQLLVKSDCFGLPSIELSKDALQYLSKSNESTERGNAWHLLLSNFYCKKDAEKVLEIQSREKLLNKKDEERLEILLEKLTTSEETKPLFESNLTAYNEREFLTKSGEIMKPDRLVLLKDKWWILDYKTGEKSDKHKNQMDFYTKALSEMGMQVEKRLLVYIDLDFEVEKV